MSSNRAGASESGCRRKPGDVYSPTPPHQGAPRRTRLSLKLRDTEGYIRVVDIVAVGAFVVAAITGIAQLHNALRGNELALFVPSKVLIKFEELSNGETYVRFSAIMAYTNTGARNSGATVHRELLQYTMGEQVYAQEWQRFHQTDLSIDDASGSYEIKMIEKGIAAPFVVTAPGATGHETYFAPAQQRCENDGDIECVYKNFVARDEFVRLIAGIDKIVFVFRADVIGDRTQIVACQVAVDDHLRDTLNGNGWATPACWEVEEPGVVSALDRI